MANTTFQCYFWDTAIGKMIACAEDVTKARAQVMATLGKKDVARSELIEAIQSEPSLLGNKPCAIVIFSQ